MAYVTKYYNTFENAAGKTIKLELQYNGFAGTATEVKLTSCSLSYPDGDLTKEAGIKRSQLNFSIYTNTPEIYRTTTATECRVVLSVNGVVNWYGWLDNPSSNFAFLDNVNLQLNAKDGLHLLESVDNNWLLNFGTNGFNTPVDIIAKALSYTELDLDFFTWIDIYPDTFPVRGAGGDTIGANDPMDSFNIHNTVFQEGMREYNDPFQALNKLCQSFNAIFFQARGQWHFVYIEDWIRNLGLTGTQWDYLGVAQSYAEYARERIYVGRTRDSFIINEDALLGNLRPAKKVTTSFDYREPVAVIKNLDLNDTTGTVSSGSGFVLYSLANWTNVSNSVYARSEVDADGNEQSRRMIFSGGGNIQSAAGLVGSGDYFTLGFNMFKSTESFSFGLRVINVTGVTTTYYYLMADGKWQTGTSSWTLIGLGTTPFDTRINLSNVDPIPANGLMEIYFSSTGNSVVWNISIDYTYKPLNKFLASGYYHEASQAIEFKTNYEKGLYISDTTGVGVRGAMLLKTVITPLQYWKHRSITEKLLFSKIINRALYKCNYRNFYTLECAIKFNYDGNYIFSPLNTFFFDELDNLEFMCSTIEVDLINDTSNATFVELLNISDSDDFDAVGTEIFRYRDFKIERNTLFDETPPDKRKGVIGFLFKLFLGEEF